MQISDGIRDGWRAEREMPQKAIPPHLTSKAPQCDYERDYRQGVRLGREYPDLTLEQALEAEEVNNA